MLHTLIRDLGRFIILVFMCIICLQTCQCSYVMRLEDGLFSPHIFARTVYIDQDFTSSQVEDIQKSLHEWENATHGAVQFDIITGFNTSNFDTMLALHQKSLIIENYPEDTPLVKNMDRQEQEKYDNKNIWVQGDYEGNQPTPTIYIISERILGRIAFVSVIEHEVGHALGLGHNPKKGTVMYAVQNESGRHVTIDDVIEYCKLHYCDPELKKE